MDTATKRLYEGLFLVDTALASSDWDGVVSEITGILEKRGGEVKSLKKWDERKLAYEIQKKTRGTYILVYFDCVTSGIEAIERDVNLSENIMRAMILRADQMGEADINKETPEEAAARAEKEAEEAKAAAAEAAEKAAAKEAEGSESSSEKTEE